MIKENITWDEVLECVNIIANDISYKTKIGKLHIDLIYGIPRGGYYPAMMLSSILRLQHKMNIPFTLGIDNLTKEKYKNILVIDDIADTGNTFIKVLQEHTFAGTASLFRRSTSEVYPAFHGKIIHTNNWLVFPWEEGGDNV